jgi:hypothetical protein
MAWSGPLGCWSGFPGIKSTTMTRFLLFSLIVCLLVIVGMCDHISHLEKKQEDQPASTKMRDTVFIEKPYVPQKLKPNNTPGKVKVYTAKDTLLRNEREKESINENVHIKENDKGQVTEVDITRIDTSGQVTEDIHKIGPDTKDIEIGNTGQVEVKKKTRAGRILQKAWKGTKTGLMIVGGITVVIISLEYL